MLERLRRSLAFRLAVQSSRWCSRWCAGLLFSRALLGARERSGGPRPAPRSSNWPANLTGIYTIWVETGLRFAIELNSNGSPEVQVLLLCASIDSRQCARLRLGAPGLDTDAGAQQIPLPGQLGDHRHAADPLGPHPRRTRCADYAIASAQLADGSVLQVGRSTDSRAVLLRPLRRAFGGVGAAALALSLFGRNCCWRGAPPGRCGR
jgi:hypothetical protein